MRHVFFNKQFFFLLDEANLDGGHAAPMFKTGSGRSILASENSRKKAQVILEAEEAVKSGNFMF